MANADAKQLFQSEVVEAFKATARTPHPYRIALYAGTGAGKTKAALDCARWFYDHQQRGMLFIACHMELARDTTWPGEMKEWLGDHPLMLWSDRHCYAMLHKIKGNHYSMAIFDEAHYLTAKSAQFLKNNTFGAIIILTATEPRNAYKKKVINDVVGNNKFLLPVDEGVDRGMTNDYRIDIFYLAFDKTTPYIRLPWQKADDETLHTEDSAYFEYCSWIEEAKGWTSAAKILPMRYAALMQFMAGTRTKMGATRWMMEQLKKKDRRFIVFAQAIDQAERLSEYVMHSQTDDRYYQQFCALQIDHLITIRQIKEGANIPALAKAILMQCNTNPGDIIQYNGRLLRLDASDQSSLLVPIFRYSYDDIWITKACKKFARWKLRKRELSFETYKDFWYD